MHRPCCVRVTMRGSIADRQELSCRSNTQSISNGILNARSCFLARLPLFGPPKGNARPVNLAFGVRKGTRNRRVPFRPPTPGSAQERGPARCSRVEAAPMDLRDSRELERLPRRSRDRSRSECDTPTQPVGDRRNRSSAAQPWVPLCVSGQSSSTISIATMRHAPGGSWCRPIHRLALDITSICLG